MASRPKTAVDTKAHRGGRPTTGDIPIGQEVVFVLAAKIDNIIVHTRIPIQTLVKIADDCLEKRCAKPLYVPSFPTLATDQTPEHPLKDTDLASES
ncbi:hypothetical protein BG006_008225 [Podila minutissima]|uniref:Uncharacterized protein n=1 Tax=Podila minutissima TaxID=64525 RepID=A0A9P5SK10_9FUNG|nr:hypothetical protein BG006_008225 [Podila minutissima]